MTLPLDAAPTRELRGNFALLRADALRLLLPRDDVGATTHVTTTPRPTELAGFFEYADPAGELAVVALSSTLRPLAAFPADRCLMTAIETPLGEIGFGWSEVAVLLDARLQVWPVPQELLTEQTPLREFVEIDGHVVFCCDKAQIAAYAFPNPD